MSDLNWNEILICYMTWRTDQIARMTEAEQELMQRLPVPVETVDAEVLAAAVDFTGNETKARRWLGTPLIHFQGRTLAEVATESVAGRTTVIGYISAVQCGNYL